MPVPQMTSSQREKQRSDHDQHIIMKALLVIVILLLIGLPVLLIKFDVRGIGEKTRPLIEDIPYVQNILPPIPDPEDPQYMNKGELTKRYLTYKEDYEKLSKEAEQLKQELQDITDIRQNYQKFLEDQKNLEEKEKTLQQESQQLEQDRENFFNDIKDEKKTDFKEYYEKIEKEKAQELYEAILTEEKTDQQVKSYVSYYEKMEAENAAKIFDEMGSSKLDLIVSIVKAMNKEKAAEILSSMDVSLAARIADRLSKEYPMELQSGS